jgi:hypothetical protein
MEREVLKLVVQAHITDYQVIQARIMMWVPLQFVPWATLAVFFAVIDATHRLFDAWLVAWGTAMAGVPVGALFPNVHCLVLLTFLPFCDTNHTGKQRPLNVPSGLSSALSIR